MSSPARRTPVQRRGGAIVLVAFVALVATAIAAGFAAWPHLRQAQLLAELEDDPATLEAWLLDRDITAERTAALDRYLLDSDGKRALFNIYLAELDNCKFSGMPMSKSLQRRVESPAGVTHGYVTLSGKGYQYAFMTPKGVSSSLSMPNHSKNPARRERILQMLDACANEVLRVEDHPRIEFIVRKITNRSAPLPPWWPAGPKGRKTFSTKRAEHVCFFRFVSPQEAASGS